MQGKVPVSGGDIENFFWKKLEVVFSFFYELKCAGRESPSELTL